MAYKCFHFFFKPRGTRSKSKYLEIGILHGRILVLNQLFAWVCFDVLLWNRNLFFSLECVYIGFLSPKYLKNLWCHWEESSLKAYEKKVKMKVLKLQSVLWETIFRFGEIVSRLFCAHKVNTKEVTQLVSVSFLLTKQAKLNYDGR